MQKETQKPAIETVESKIPAQLRGLFCEPPQLENENPELYWGLLGAVIDERKPQTAEDWIAVNDLVTKLWEERVFRRASNALIRGGMPVALEHFLAMVRKGEERTKEIGEVRKYFSDNPKERSEIRSRLARYGISQAELYAKAAQQNSDALQMFERMIAARERSRRKLRKEDERRRRRQNAEMKKIENEQERIAVASEKQLRANRENAKRSSGPKTAAGRLKSSRNALRHGLSLPLTADPAAAIKAHQIAQMLAPQGADDRQVMAAVEMAQAHAQLLRVAAVRGKLVANLEFASANLKQVRRLAALDRYERQALTRRRRAARKLSAASDPTIDS